MCSKSQHDCQESGEIVQYLIDKGANVNSVNKNNRTALDAAFKANKIEGKIRGWMEKRLCVIIWEDICIFLEHLCSLSSKRREI